MYCSQPDLWLEDWIRLHASDVHTLLTWRRILAFFPNTNSSRSEFLEESAKHRCPTIGLWFKVQTLVTFRGFNNQDDIQMPAIRNILNTHPVTYSHIDLNFLIIIMLEMSRAFFFRKHPFILKAASCDADFNILVMTLQPCWQPVTRPASQKNILFEWLDSPDGKAPPNHHPFIRSWTISKTSPRSPWASFLAGSMCVCARV